MNHFTIALITGLACMFCWGCDSVRTKHPIGTPATQEEITRITGRYQSDKDMIQVHGTGGNTMRAGFLKWDEGSFEVQELDIHVGVIEKPDSRFYVMNLHDLQAKPSPNQAYDFVLARQRENTLIIWPANIPAFAQAVRDEKLAGTIKEENVLNVLLEDTGEKLTAFLEAADLAHYFHWEEPFFLERVGE